MDVYNYVLHKLKDQSLLVITHIPGNKNDADIFTKNLMSAIFNHHIPLYIGCDEYLEQTLVLSEEIVGR